MLTLKQLKHKQVYLDDATKELLQGMRQDRLRLSLLRRQLADMLEIPQMTLRNYERGKGIPNILRFIQIGKFFGWDIEKNINCMFARVLVNKAIHSLFMKNVAQLGMSIQEISTAVHFHEYTVTRILNAHDRSSVRVFAAILKLIRDKQSKH